MLKPEVTKGCFEVFGTGKLWNKPTEFSGNFLAEDGRSWTELSMVGKKLGWFWYQSKARMQLPISPTLSLWSTFLRYGDLLTKNSLFFLSLAHSASSLPMFPLEFCAEVNHKESRLMGLSCREDRMSSAEISYRKMRGVGQRLQRLRSSAYS